MMKKFFVFVFSCLILFGCEPKEQTETANEFTRSSVVNSQDSSNIQYNIKWDNIDYSPVDIRIITLKKDGEIHDYVVANNYIGRAGGLSISHWAGCKCLKNNKIK